VLHGSSFSRYQAFAGTRERTGSVLHGSSFSRYQAFAGGIIPSKPGSISLSGFTRLYRVLLPQRQTENSESET
jgi:hypothetical protein